MGYSPVYLSIRVLQIKGMKLRYVSVFRRRVQRRQPIPTDPSLAMV